MSKLYDAFCDEFDTCFNKAIRDTDNLNEDGTVIWSFVDADCYVELSKRFGPLPNDTFYELFDNYVEGYYVDKRYEQLQDGSGEGQYFF